MRITKASLAAACLLIAGTGTALAHAFPVREIPPAGAVLKTAPASVVIVLSEAVNAHFSGISVTTARGERVDDGHSARRPDDDKLLSVRIEGPLKAGKYTVAWHALAADGHRTQGSYDFVVAP